MTAEIAGVLQQAILIDGRFPVSDLAGLQSGVSVCLRADRGAETVVDVVEMAIGEEES